MKFLGIDYGTKRIGVAVSDESGTLAFPKEIIYIFKIAKKSWVEVKGDFRKAWLSIK